jgi:hypothetical protein
MDIVLVGSFSGRRSSRGMPRKRTFLVYWTERLLFIGSVPPVRVIALQERGGNAWIGNLELSPRTWWDG